ncbi:FGGY family carbohydrate kinase [Serratia ficaria]|uniref:FGGY family carbohydrate kinase n=1 Tax=Serratia ficaria TaxID=61651 RepID=UPI002178A995|nr:FGGY-family carbohydrate kinase [Serratia ficaria]CAI1199026.1 Glycerol kinase [Serratia ficaria]CAI1234925.1 Glycerol kinase [Serratia ficaria]CAI2021548.1 Glycerol kinase [Serratia ficaria]CAI2527959.1 Glycerol kinase [Serratia ficaria]CAI2534731.1 Glycerol kinase [Serratia ficaria]
MARKEVIIALDEGTTNAKAVALDNAGKVLVSFSRPLAIQTLHEGWVEQSADLLVDASVDVLSKAIAAVGAGNVAALAISNQRETAVGWYRDNGRPLAAALTWQCSRTAEFCQSLRQEGKEAQIKAVTGLPVAPLFSASKMRWLLESVPNGFALAEQGDICLGTVDSWLLWKLTGGKKFCCDYSNAARTQLLNLHSATWDDGMLALFGIPRSALPDIRPSSGLFGHTSGCKGIPDGIPIMAMIGDSHAALFAHGLGAMGCVKATYGTGSSVMVPVSSAQCDVSALATTVAWHDGDQLVYALEGNIPHTGDAVAWILESTGLDLCPPAEQAQQLSEFPASVDSSLGVYFVPALTGLGAPWWDESARGIICGLSRGVKRAHLVRAALESITYQIADVVMSMRQHSEFSLTALMVDGGPTKNDWLLQYQADLLGCPVMRSDVAELSAVGAALLARKALLQLSVNDLGHYLPAHSIYQPDAYKHERLRKNYEEWNQAVRSVLSN